MLNRKESLPFIPAQKGSEFSFFAFPIREKLIYHNSFPELLKNGEYLDTTSNENIFGNEFQSSKSDKIIDAFAKTQNKLKTFVPPAPTGELMLSQLFSNRSSRNFEEGSFKQNDDYTKKNQADNGVSKNRSNCPKSVDLVNKYPLDNITNSIFSKKPHDFQNVFLDNKLVSDYGDDDFVNNIFRLRADDFNYPDRSDYEFNDDAPYNSFNNDFSNKLFNYPDENKKEYKTSNLISLDEIVPDIVLPKTCQKNISSSTFNSSNLRSISELPQKFRFLFPFSHFNLLQSKVFDETLYTSNPMVIGAPTGAGKTVVFELAILRLILLKEIKPEMDFKVIYMAPIKALVSEKFTDWKNKFSDLGLNCCELTGDSDIEDYYLLSNVQLILTTPEKWDFMTRRWRQNRSIMRQVKLFLIDEVHTIGDNDRGATLEAVVNRMKTVEEFERMMMQRKEGDFALEVSIRFMAASATIPNIEDLAKWLGSVKSSAFYYQMDDSQRPVPLKRIVLGYARPNSSSAFKFDLMLNYRLPHVLELYSDMKPAIVFCSTRKGTTQAAQVLAKEMKFYFKQEEMQWLKKASYEFRDSKLSETVSKGIGYHHAGLEVNDRKLVEQLFSSGRLAVLLSTSTLAMGVNLPAHLVVIKSTQHYVMGEYAEYSESQVLQMIGRAGRPQFDTSATAVIMTQNETKSRYEFLLNGTQLVESSLHQHLIEHINAEIALETIRDVSIALRWIESSYLFVRINKNPKYYGINPNGTSDGIEKKIHEFCLSSLKKLASLDLITMDEDCFTLSSTDAGRLMSRYCVAFETIKLFYGFNGEESLSDLLEAFCLSTEFKDFILRTSEKRVLNELNKHKNKQTIRFPMKEKIKSSHAKISCLIQTHLGCLPLQDFALQQDTNKIFRNAPRMMRCLVDMLWHKPHFKLLQSAVLMYKCFRSKLWENSKYVAKQLNGIGLVMATALVNNSITSFDSLLKTNPRNLEIMVNRRPPFGNTLHEAAKMLPRYDLKLSQTKLPIKYDEAQILVSVHLTNASEISSNPTCGLRHTCILLVGTSSNEIVCKAKISDSLLVQIDGNIWTNKFVVKQSSGEITAHLISQDWVGFDVSQTFAPTFFTSSITNKTPETYKNTQSTKTPKCKTKKEKPSRNEYEKYVEEIQNYRNAGPAFKKLKPMTPSISDFSFKKNLPNMLSEISSGNKMVPYNAGLFAKCSHHDDGGPVNDKYHSLKPQAGITSSTTSRKDKFNFSKRKSTKEDLKHPSPTEDDLELVAASNQLVDDYYKNDDQLLNVASGNFNVINETSFFDDDDDDDDDDEYFNMENDLVNEFQNERLHNSNAYNFSANHNSSINNKDTSDNYWPNNLNMSCSKSQFYDMSNNSKSLFRTTL